MFKHLWVERGSSLPNQKNLYFSNNEPILSSMLAANIVQDMFVGEVGEGEHGRKVEKTGGYFYHLGRKFFPFRSN